MSKYVIRLEGERARGANASSVLLRDLLDVVVDGTRQAIRLRVEGRSTARSLDPEWLVDAADFEIVAFEEGSTAVVCEQQTLGDAAPETFAQGDFFTELDGDRPPLDVFESALSDVQREDRDSDKYDDRILETLGHFKRLFRRGVERVQFGDQRGLAVEPADLDTFDELKKSTPEPTEVRVTGTLDSLTLSRRAFKLKLLDGDQTVRGSFDQEILDDFKELIGERVAVSGRGTFKPSEQLRKVDARSIRSARDADDLWERVPESTSDRESREEFRQPQDDQDGLSALLGEWPGEETDEEVRRALEELS